MQLHRSVRGLYGDVATDRTNASRPPNGQTDRFGTSVREANSRRLVMRRWFAAPFPVPIFNLAFAVIHQMEQVADARMGFDYAKGCHRRLQCRERLDLDGARGTAGFMTGWAHGGQIDLKRALRSAI